MAHIVILGAGLTGLSAAYHLEKRGFFDFEIFEKEPQVGGLCRTIQEKGFTFDFTGHLLHINDPYFKQFVQDTLGFDHLESIHRRSFIYSNGVYTKYPFQVHLHGLPNEIIASCIEGYVKRKKRNKTKKDFIDWAYEQFGAGIARSFFIPYQQKIFAHDLHDITPSWTGRFVPTTSLKSMIAGALAQKADEPIGYNSQFFYPKVGGIQAWINAIRSKIQKKIYTHYSVQSVDISNRIVHFSNGHSEPFTQLINTIPLDVFLRLVKEPTHMSFKQAADQLLCNSVVNFNIGTSTALSEKHWIYFPEKQFPFYRLGFPHNFSKQSVPAGCSSLYGEFAHVHAKPFRINKLLKESLMQTKNLLHIATQEIVLEKIITIDHAYVIYNFWREKNLPKLLHALEEENIFSIGRYGAWKYASMQEAVLDGKQTAEKITIMPALTPKEKKIIYRKTNTIKQPQL